VRGERRVEVEGESTRARGGLSSGRASGAGTRRRRRHRVKVHAGVIVDVAETQMKSGGRRTSKWSKGSRRAQFERAKSVSSSRHRRRFEGERTDHASHFRGERTEQSV
jgi:hypothetical protein